MRQAVRRCPEPRTATTDGSAEPSGVSAADSAAVRPQRRGGRGGRTPTAPHVRPAGTVLVGVSAHRSTRPAAGRHGGRVRASAAIVDGRCAARVGHPTGDAARVSDTRCPQRGRRTGRCPPAQRPADMTVEAAAEGPQRFAQAAVMAPVAGHLTAAGRTLPGHPSARRTTWPHTGQDAGCSGRSIR